MRTLEQDYDLFFIRQDFYDQHLQDFKEELILPKLDYYQHPVYSSIHAISSYQTWKITFDYVIVQQACWYENLPQNLQYDLLNEQRRNHNAMMYKDNLVTINFWHRMPKSWQDEMIEGLDDSFSDVRIPDNIPERMKEYPNLLFIALNMVNDLSLIICFLWLKRTVIIYLTTKPILNLKGIIYLRKINGKRNF